MTLISAKHLYTSQHVMFVCVCMYFYITCGYICVCLCVYVVRGLYVSGVWEQNIMCVEKRTFLKLLCTSSHEYNYSGMPPSSLPPSLSPSPHRHCQRFSCLLLEQWRGYMMKLQYKEEIIPHNRESHYSL